MITRDELLRIGVAHEAVVTQISQIELSSSHSQKITWRAKVFDVKWSVSFDPYNHRFDLDVIVWDENRPPGYQLSSEASELKEKIEGILEIMLAGSGWPSELPPAWFSEVPC